MMAKFGKWIVREVAYLVGGVALFFIAWTLWPSAKTAERPASAAPVVEAKNAEVEQVATACICGSGVVCIGPRGGKFCVTDTGKKKYL